MQWTDPASSVRVPEPISDWDVAYSNQLAVPEFPSWIGGATEQSVRFHQQHAHRSEIDVKYGDHARHTFDVYEPSSGPAAGTVVFVHGGYWKASTKEQYRYLAAGPLARGWRVVLPEYPLCPEVTIAEIATGLVPMIEEIAARWGDTPVVLSGHSAGGHLVTYLASVGSGVSDEALRSIRRVVSLSGLHDLRPLIKATELNSTLKLDPQSAYTLSPVLREPGGAFDLICACGAAELAEFRRQNSALADVWFGFGNPVRIYEYAERNHFTLLDPMADGSSELTALLTLER